MGERGAVRLGEPSRRVGVREFMAGGLSAAEVARAVLDESTTASAGAPTAADVPQDIEALRHALDGFDEPLARQLWTDC